MNGSLVGKGGAPDRPALLLEVSGLSKHYPGVDALVDVDFTLEAGEVHVLFGENGAGKSTLIGIVAGAIAPTRGVIRFRGRPVVLPGVRAARNLGISAVFQEFSLVPSLTVEENLFLGTEMCRAGALDKRAMRRLARELLARLGFPLEPGRHVQSLSRAEQQMVEIAKAFSTDLSVLILDEPTASLTERETERLFALIGQAKSQGVGVIYITHRMAEIHQIADRITVLRDGRRITTAKASELSDDRLIELMAGRPIAHVFPEVRHRPTGTLLTIEGLSTATGSVADLSLVVRAGEIVGIAGLVGSGKSEVGRACFGVEPIAAGRIRFLDEDVTGFAPRAMLDRGLFYLPPDRRAEGLLLERNSIENVSLAALDQPSFSRGPILQRRKGREAVSNVMRRLGLYPFDLTRAVGHFSGGNQQKVLLGKSLSRSVRLFIFDEPTVGVDVSTRAEIYRLVADLAERGAGVLLVSSDLPEVLHLSNRAYVMFRGRVQAELRRDEISEDRMLTALFGERAA